jgi:hypothetical protein
MAIGKSEAATARVIAAGKINYSNVRVSETFGHLHCHGCVVDAVGSSSPKTQVFEGNLILESLSYT